MRFYVGSTAVSVTVRNPAEALARVGAALQSGIGFSLATLNLDHLVKLRDAEFAEAYAAQDLVTADGNPIVWMARLAGQEMDLVTGSDLIRPLCQLAAGQGVAIALFGATEDSLAAARAALLAEMPDLTIAAAFAPGMGFDPEGAEAEAAVARLVGSGARLVFLALGAPKQERFAAFAKERAPGLGFVSIGAGLDFISGRQNRAPLWVRRLALEWLWRMLSDPRRLVKRYALCAAVLPGHVWRSLRQRPGLSGGAGQGS